MSYEFKICNISSLSKLSIGTERNCQKLIRNFF